MKLILIQVLIACSICVLAQMPRGFGQYSFILLQQEEVRKELSLTPAQIKEVDAVFAPLHRQGGLYFGRDTNFEELQSRATRSFSDTQRKRLEQIRMWQSGGRILLDPDMAQKLKLTSKQIDAIAAIDHDMSDEIRSQADPSHGPVRIGPEITDRYAGKMLKVLTAEQRRNFDQMRGKPFKGARK
jgi:hypothetical protein